MRELLAGLRSASDWRTAIAALAGSSPPSSAAAPTSAASMRAAPTGEAAWCRCTLHSDSTRGCGAAPVWLQGHTGRDGELFFKLQDSAWGNAMMQLRDSLAIALVLNRRPVLVVDGSWSTLYRGNLSSLLEVLPRASVASARPPGVREISTVAELRAVLISRPPATQPLYTRLDWWYNTGNAAELLRLATQHARAPWARLFLAPVPPCHSLAFVRPARRLRAAALTQLDGTCAAI